MPANVECGHFVSYWDGEYEGNCILPPWHYGHHFDGGHCYDDEGDSVECWEHD